MRWQSPRPSGEQEALLATQPCPLTQPEAEVAALRVQLDPVEDDGLVGESPALTQVERLIEVAADHPHEERGVGERDALDR